MKLIKIESDSDSCIDQVLMVVPDDYDEKIVFSSSIVDMIPEPIITEKAYLYNEFGTKITGGFDEYREYWG